LINARGKFIEERLDWIYHLFTVFWSHHDLIPLCHCDKAVCSKVIVIDGHQKPRRVVCQYSNVTSIINKEEMGPCNRGCPYQPRRRKVGETSKNSEFPDTPITSEVLWEARRVLNNPCFNERCVLCQQIPAIRDSFSLFLERFTSVTSEIDADLVHVLVQLMC
jgi:hypothetical protein